MSTLILKNAVVIDGTGADPVVYGSVALLFSLAVPLPPELVEGCIATPFTLRQPQHDRLSLQSPYNYGLTSKSD